LKGMKIGYDAKRAIANNTGLGNYSRLVMKSYAIAFSGDHLEGFTPYMAVNPRLSTIRSLPNIHFTLPQGMWRHFPSLWRTYGITSAICRSGMEIFHGLSNELPLNVRESGIPSVVTIHDVIYRRLPYCYNPIDRAIYDFKYGRSCRNADCIIAISRRTARDVAEFYGISPEKIEILYQGCDESFRRRVTDDMMEEIVRRYSLPERYIVQVGTVERRKNLKLTIRALSALKADVKLVAVGRPTSYKEECLSLARELGVANRILWLGNLPFAHLPAIYQRAEVIVYPSRYEGFGLPVLEGLASSRPVVAATGSCLEEAGGDAAIYVNPDAVRDLAEAIDAILSDGELAEGMIERGKVHERRFDNARIPGRLREIYLKTIRNFQHSRLK